MKIDIVQADITKLEVDAIVNAANCALSGGGGVDGAIHKAAGRGLLDECLALGRCETGQARLTKGYSLSAKYVIHAVAPVWYGGHRNEEALLASCYHEAMKIADAQGFRSLAFPAISCGAYRFPVQKAADIAIREVLEGGKNSSVELVIMACFEKTIENALSLSLSRSQKTG